MMVEAIEDLFIPVLIYNNKKSDEAKLKAFEEPSWNNPVTRFLDADGADIVAREDGVWKREAMAARMVKTLETAEREIPVYLQSLANAATTEKATFAMHCYWEGEGKLGAIPGVQNTLSAWVGPLEVVELIYDPSQVEYAHLLETAQSFDCASKVYAHSDEQMEIAKRVVGDKAEQAPKKSRTAKLSDQKYYLRNTPGVRSLPLTKTQSTKVNAALMKKEDFRELLSPRQLAMLTEIEGYLAPESTKSMESFVFPEDDSRLAEYSLRLSEHLGSTKNDLIKE